ncbi:MAG: hypothetical protein PF904_00190, partial [Kiritimatiellae bacterium]|nr:hypothetical protein [Kiritimatiellia bacterium]
PAPGAESRWTDTAVRATAPTHSFSNRKGAPMPKHQQIDMFADQRTEYAAMIEQNCQNQQMFGTVETAGIFGKSTDTVREWIEEGWLVGHDTNCSRKHKGGRTVRPSYVITRQAILDLANRIERGY